MGALLGRSWQNMRFLKCGEMAPFAFWFGGLGVWVTLIDVMRALALAMGSCRLLAAFILTSHLQPPMLARVPTEARPTQRTKCLSAAGILDLSSKLDSLVSPHEHLNPQTERRQKIQLLEEYLWLQIMQRISKDQH